MKEDLLYYLGRLTYLIFFVLVLLVLALFHYAAISFVFRLPLMPEFSGVGRAYGAVLIGVPTAVVDVLLYRYVTEQILEARWVAENKRRHEEKMRLEHAGKQATRR